MSKKSNNKTAVLTKKVVFNFEIFVDDKLSKSGQGTVNVSKNLDVHNQKDFQIIKKHIDDYVLDDVKKWSKKPDFKTSKVHFDIAIVDVIDF